LGLVAAASLKVGLFDIAFSNAAQGALAPGALRNSFLFTFFYGLPLAALAVAMTEIFRLRHVAVHLLLGMAVALVAAYFLVRAEPLTSPVFVNGALSGACILLIGLLSSFLHWLIAGRRAGWRGIAAEKAEFIATEVFRMASANAKSQHCVGCALTWSALGLILFAVTTWTLIEKTGLRKGLITKTEQAGKGALEKRGFTWASFRIEGGRGVIEGLAPDDTQKTAAYDAVRDALNPAVGVPGVLVEIKNNAVARMPLASASEKLADSVRRDAEAKAKAAVEAARIATVSAGGAEAEAKQKPQEQTKADDAERKRKAAEARAVEDETRRKLDEKIRDEAAAIAQRPAGDVARPR
jgi:hypothetical protein